MSASAPRRPLLRRFGLSGFAFPEIGLGTWTFSGRDFGAVDERECTEVIRGALDLGVRFFDTADVYGHGRVEELLAAAFGDAGKAAFLSTKVGNDFGGADPGSRKNFDPDYLRAALAASARRLRRPVVDLVHLHNPPSEALADGRVLELLAGLKRDGRVRLVALSTVHGEQVREVTEGEVFDALQIPFNLLRQELLLTCRSWIERWGGGVIVRTPLEYGLLGGSLPPASELTSDDYRRRAWEPEEETVKRAVVAELAQVLASDGKRSLAQAALQFALIPDCVSVVIPGSRNLRQLRSNVAASRDVPPLEPQAIRAADGILRDAGLASGIRSELLSRPAVVVLGEVKAATPRPEPQVGRLGETWRIGKLRLDNRILRSGTTERAVDERGQPTAAMRQIHVDLARGGAGMAITGYLAVEWAGRASTSHCVLADRGAAAAWSEIIRACREVRPQARLCAQLAHGGSRSLGTFDADGVAESFARAAELAAEAGFDAVQLHAAHGYLLSQLLAEPPALRLSRARHPGLSKLSCIVRAVRGAVGNDFPLLAKVNMSDFSPGSYDAPDAEAAVAVLVDLGVDALEWSAWVPEAGAYESPSRPGQVEPRSEGFFLPFAQRIKERKRGLAVGTCGGFRTAAGMLRGVADGRLDFVALARPLIAEPDLPGRLLAGETCRAFCDGCNECLPRTVRPLHCPPMARSQPPIITRGGGV